MKLQKLFTELETQRTFIINSLKDVPHDTLNKRPAAKAWSVNMNIEHLIVAEETALIYLKKKMSFAPKLSKSGILPYLRYILLKFVFILPLKFKVPKVIDNLSENSDLATLDKRWAKTRTEMHDFLAAQPDAFFDAAIFKHPLAGKLTAEMMLKFFASHVNRHQGQIVRTLEQVVI